MEVSTEYTYQNDQIDYQLESSEYSNQEQYNYTYDENGNYEEGYDMNAQQYTSPRDSIQSSDLQSSTNTHESYNDWSTDFNEDDYKDGEDSESSDSKRSTQQEDSSSEQANLSQRTKVVREILETEKIYVNSMFSIIKSFLIPLKIAVENGNPIISSEKIQVIFGNIEQLYSHNNLLQTDLEAIVSVWEDTNTIGDVFLNRMPGFSVYKEYVKNHQDSIHVLKKLEKKTQWTQFLQNVKESGETGRLDIYSFLIQPVQRIPRYELLLRDLIKTTDASHTDHSLLKKALDEFMSLSMQVNTEMQRHDNYMRLCSVEKSITGLPKEYLVSPERLIVREGSLMKVCRKTSKKRYFFLFSDCLMYSSIVTVGTEYKYSRTINLSENKAKVKDLPDSNDVKHAFQIISSEKSFTVFAENHKEKDSWLQCLKSVLTFWSFVSTSDQDMSSKTRFSVQYNQKFEGLLALSFQHNKNIFVLDEKQKSTDNAHLSASTNESSIDAEIAPVWIPDAHASFCMVCGDHFTVIKRRHHCRNCGKVICGSCSKQKRRLAHTASDKEVRVCLICFEFLKLQQVQKTREEEVRQASAAQSASAPPTLNEPKMQGFSYFGGSMPARRRESNAETSSVSVAPVAKASIGRNRSVTTGALYDAAPPPPMAESQPQQQQKERDSKGTRERGMSIRKFFGRRNQVKDDTFKEPENTATTEKAPAPSPAPTTTPPTPANTTAAPAQAPAPQVQNPGVKVLPAIIPQFKLRSNTVQDLSTSQSQSHATQQPVNAGTVRPLPRPTPAPTTTPAPQTTQPSSQPPTQTTTSPPQVAARPLPTKGALVLPSKPQTANAPKPASNVPPSAITSSSSTPANNKPPSSTNLPTTSTTTSVPATTTKPTAIPPSTNAPVSTPATSPPQESSKSRPAPPPASAKPQRSLTVTQMETAPKASEAPLKPTPPARSPRDSPVTLS